MRCTHAWPVTSPCPKRLQQELIETRSALMALDNRVGQSHRFEAAHAVLTDFVRAAGFTRVDLKPDWPIVHMWLWENRGVWPLAFRCPVKRDEPQLLTLINAAKKALLAKFVTIKS